MLPMWLPIINRIFGVGDTKKGNTKKNDVGETPTDNESEIQGIAGSIEGEIISSKPPITSVCRKLEPIVLVHGGAGNIPDYLVPAKLNCVKKAAIAGFKVLKQGGTSLDAVETAIKIMEDDPIMNAGVGSVLNYDGEVEADACIMVGKTLEAGGVTGVKDVANPISLAKMVMEKSPHALLAGEGAKKFAEDNNFKLEEPGSLVTLAAKEALEAYKLNPEEDLITERTDIEEKPEKAVPMGSVGAIAMDRVGHIAVGLSTGGMTGKMPGRVGDSPQIGKGAYCNDYFGGVAVTGHGESISKYCLSMRILKEMERGKKPIEAATEVLLKMKEKFNKDGGAVCIGLNEYFEGVVGVFWTARRMPWAYQKGEQLHYGVELGEDNKEESIKDIWPRTESVGAIAIDRKGKIAVGASSGGWNGKSTGKFNEACSIGGGIYADDDLGGVSLTGYGKFMIRMMLALQITQEMERRSAQRATWYWIRTLYCKFREVGGGVGISRYGDIGVYFNTQRMPWAYQKRNILHYGIDPDDEKRDITC